MDKTYPLNDYQASIFNLEMKYPGTDICNMGGTITYHKHVNFEVLSSAINIFIKVSPDIRLRLNREDRLYISDFYPRKISINDTADIHTFPTVCELFEKIAVQNPDKIALVDENIAFTYRQASDRSNQVAHLLEQMHLPKGSIAAIMIGRCAYLPIAMLGVMKAGYAFLPVDPQAP